MIKDLRILPQVKDSISYLYFERCVIAQENSSIMAVQETGNIPIPIASCTCLMLGPGVSITHAAIKVITDNGCMIVWCGDHGTQFYASGRGETRDASNILIQAKFCMDEQLHMKVVRRMFSIRFPNIDCSKKDLQQIRGIEGARVRQVYKTVSKIYGVPWKGRIIDGDWDEADPINKALSTANSILYNFCHAAIFSLGYSPDLGFVHNGQMRAFVYDIADIYKVDVTIPAAFEAVKTNKENPEKEIKRLVRKHCQKIKLMHRIAKDISFLFEENDKIKRNNSKNDNDIIQEQEDIIFYEVPEEEEVQNNNEVENNGSNSD